MQTTYFSQVSTGETGHDFVGSAKIDRCPREARPLHAFAMLHKRERVVMLRGPLYFWSWAFYAMHSGLGSERRIRRCGLVCGRNFSVCLYLCLAA